jgi:hypothetical protein
MVMQVGAASQAVPASAVRLARDLAARVAANPPPWLARQPQPRDYYTNVDGIRVPSPVYAAAGAVPTRTTALCRDGLYSFSQHRQGTCSNHGGVTQWMFTGSPGLSGSGLVPMLGTRTSGEVSVRGYTRGDGTYVPPHTRSAPDASTSNDRGPSRGSGRPR